MIPAAADNDEEEEEEEREEETEMEKERRLGRWYIHFLTLKERSCKIPIVVQDYLQLFSKKKKKKEKIRGSKEEKTTMMTTEEDCTRALPCFSGVGAPALARISIVKIGIASRNVSTLAR